MTNNTPLVSIVILNWNGLEDTKICLEHVRKLTYPNYEVIVVDNGSEKNEKEYLSKLKDIIYVDNPKNRGFAGGQADGYKHANGDFILLLNNDAVIKSDYLDKALPLFTDSQVAVVGGRSYFWNDDERLLNESNQFYSYMNVNPVSAETTLLMQDYGTIQEVNVVSGSSVIVRRSTVEKVGYLWEPFFAYYEETDLFARIKRAGYKVLYNPALQIWHKNGASSGAQGGSSFFYYHIFRNRYMFAVRNFDTEFLKAFKKTYMKSAKQAASEAPRGAVQRRIAKAYSKAIASVRADKNLLNSDRKKLQEQLDNTTYSRQIIKEQTGISIVIDCSKLSPEYSAHLYEKLALDTNPLHEYILVTREDEPSTKSPSRNVRFVVDRGYFNTHSINLGCLAAQHSWIAVSDMSSQPDITTCLNIIAETYLEKPLVIDLPGTAALFTKSIFELSGGFQQSKVSLKKNIQYLLNYAHVDQSLSASTPPTLNDATKNDFIAKIDTDRRLLSLRRVSNWQSLLERYYRLQQLSNLTRWAIHPKISLRVKAGRTKNLLISGATLNKERLATELKHIRNEVFLQSNQQKIINATSSYRKDTEDFSKKQLTSVGNIPVFIICFERINDLTKLIKTLEDMGLKKIVLIDNDSTYKPLLDFYNKTPYQVLRLQRNIGHTSPWSLGVVRTLIPHGYYIVTDPDVLPAKTAATKESIQHLISLHQKYHAHQKVGFGLKIDDLPDHYPLKNDVIAWEGQFWKSTVEPEVYEAGVDTTFALYKPGTFLYTLNPSLRTGEPYTARHMPWYSNPAKPTDEDKYYKVRANANVTSWNVDELPDRYKKEMESAKTTN